MAPVKCPVQAACGWRGDAWASLSTGQPRRLRWATKPPSSLRADMAGQTGSARDTGWVSQTDSVGGALTEEIGIEPTSVDPRCVPVTLNPFDMNGY